MTLPPDLEARVQSRYQLARIVGLGTCYAAPAIYAVLLFLVPLQGHLGALRDITAVPWSNPLTLGLLIVTAGNLGTTFVMKEILLAPARTPERLFTVHVVLCALLEAVAIVGLVMGLVLGAPAAPLAFLLLLVPAALYPFVLPTRETWRTHLERTRD